MKIFLASILLIFSCNNKSDKEKASDEIDSLIFKAKVAKMSDSLMKSIGNEDFKKAETLSSSCPIDVKSIKIYNPQYSSSKAYSITYKNVSDKPVDAIRFIIYGENNWGEAEAISLMGTAYGYCESQEKINPGKLSQIHGAFKLVNLLKQNVI